MTNRGYGLHRSGRLFSVTFLVCSFIAQLQGQPAPKPDNKIIWDLAALEKSPDYKWTNQDGPVRELLYQSVGFEGRPTEVFAYYSNPDLLLGRRESMRKYPGIVLVHGGGGTAFKEWVEKWAAEGYAAIAMDLSGRDGNGEKLKNAGPGQGHDDKFTKIESGSLQDVWTYHAIASVLLAHSWIRSQPVVDSTKTALTGISWGGYLTNIAGAVDPRFKAAVPVYGCGYYDESDVFSESLEKISAEGKTKWMAYFDPSVYLPAASTRFLFLNGNKDRFYNVIPYHKTYSLVKPEKRDVLILPDMKHSHYHGWEPHEIKYYIENILYDKAPLPEVGKAEEISGYLTASFTSPVQLNSAAFYYSSDTLSPNETRKWETQKAEIDTASGTLKTKLPEGGFRYGFFYVRDHRNLSGSGEFIIHD